MVDLVEELIEVGDRGSRLGEADLGGGVELIVDGVEKLDDAADDFVEGDVDFFARVALAAAELLFREVARAELDSERDSFLLPIIKLEPGRIILPIVHIRPHPSLLQIRLQLIHPPIQTLRIVLFRVEPNRQNHNLILRHSRRDNQALVVTVDHDHHPNRSRGEPPGRLPGQFLLFGATFRLELDFEHLGEVLAQVVRGAGLGVIWGNYLNSAPVLRDPCLDCGRFVASRELFLFGFDLRNGEVGRGRVRL